MSLLLFLVPLFCPSPDGLAQDAIDRAQDDMIREFRNKPNTAPVLAPGDARSVPHIGEAMRGLVERAQEQRREEEQRREKERCPRCGGPTHSGRCPTTRERRRVTIPIGIPPPEPPRPQPPPTPDALPPTQERPTSAPTPETPHAPDPAPVLDGPTPTTVTHDPDPECPIELDIHPVQVVQDPDHEHDEENIPLIQGKSTIVRVFVKFRRSRRKKAKEATCYPEEDLKGAKCVLEREGKTYEITADIIRGPDHTWVIPVEPPNADPLTPTTYQKALDYLASRKGRETPTRSLPSFLKGDTFWAFNFDPGAGNRLCPAQLSLTAKLYIKGALSAELTETSHDHFKIRKYLGSRDPGCFNVVVGAFASKQIPDQFIPRELSKTPGIKGDRAKVQATPFFQQLVVDKAEQYKNEILAVYPVPDDAVKLTILKEDLLCVGAVLPGCPFMSADFFAGPASISTLEENRFPSADTLLFVTNPFESNTPDDQFESGEPLASGCSGWTPFFSKSIHYITCGTQLSALVAAHETGHDSRFFGLGHADRHRLEDGWDAGHRLGQSMFGADPLMLAVQEQPWIAVDEYRKLLRVLTGGADPVLVQLHGILEPDGKLELAPPSVVMGTAPARTAGAGSLAFLDGKGKAISFWPVPLQEVKKRRGFNISAPLPEKARSITLTLPGKVSRTFQVSAKPPELEWTGVDVAPDGNSLRVRFKTSHPEGLPVSVRFVYSPDGQRHIDLPAPQGAPAAGEIVLSVKGLPGGRAAHLTAWATAGLKLTSAISAPFVVPDRAPWLWVSERPALAGAERYGSTLYDPERGFDLNPTWSADAGTPLGEGRSPDAKRLATLAAGPHRLTATVVDAAGQRASASMDVVLPAALEAPPAR